MVTTDFQGWLGQVPLEEHDDVYSLYHSVSKCEEWGMFKTQSAKGGDERWIVSCRGCDDSLLLASTLAKETFLNHIEKAYCEDLTIEGWYAYKKAMEKGD